MHLYGCHWEMQFGPIAIVAAATFQMLPIAIVKPVAMLVMLLTGPLLVAVLAHARRAADGSLPSGPVVLIAGVVVMPAWATLAVGYAHLDDVLALAALVVSIAMLSRRQYAWATVVLAISALAKPWAVGFVPLLCFAPRARRPVLLITFAAVVSAGWAPFVIGDSNTLRLSDFAITNAPSSALRALGFTDPVTPTWDRPVQLLLALALGALLVRVGRWAAVPLGVLAVRMVLDPQVYAYYTAGLILAAVILDVVGPSGRGRRWPWWTTICGGWAVVDLLLVADNQARGAVRLVFLLSLILGLVWLVGRRPDDESRLGRSTARWNRVAAPVRPAGGGGHYGSVGGTLLVRVGRIPAPATGRPSPLSVGVAARGRGGEPPQRTAAR